MVFDYVQMVYDFAATKLPAHAYTKEAMFAKQFGLTGIKVFAKFVEIPKGRLFPIIFMLAVVGAYVTNNMIAHIGWMMLFGLLGYILKKFGFPASPLVLGIVLGNLMETNWRNSLMSFRGFGGVINSIFTRPITLVLFLVVLWTLVKGTRPYRWCIEQIKGLFAKKK